MVIDSAGNVYTAAFAQHMILRVSPNGIVSTFAGQSYSACSTDATSTTAVCFSGPRGLAIDSAGNLYVADTGNHIIRKVTPDGVVTTLLAKPQLELYNVRNLLHASTSAWTVQVGSSDNSSGVVLVEVYALP